MMGWPVVVVESGGIPVTEVLNGLGTAVDIADNGYGVAVTLVESGGLPVIGAASVDLSGFLLYDNFAGVPEPLDGRTPNKGAAWTASGGAADNMIAGGGLLIQDADTYPDNGAGYAFANLGAVAKKLTATWEASAITYVPTFAISTGTLNTSACLHGEMGTTFFLLRLSDGAGNFLIPGWSMWSDAYALSPGTTYVNELHYDGGTVAAMVLKDSEGNILGQQLAYDRAMADYVGNYAFWETFDTKMGYLKATAAATSDYAFPTITEVSTGDLNDFVVSAFGGTKDLTSGILTISGSGVFEGLEMAIGSVTTGDVLAISIDVTEAVSGTGEIGIIPFGTTGPTLAQDDAANVLPGIPSGTGRKTIKVTVTADNANASLIICNTGSDGAFSLKTRDVTVIKNPPTSFGA